MRSDKLSWPAARWLLAVIVAAVGILAMPRLQYIGDPLAIRAAAANWINTGRIDVPEAVALSSGQRGQYYFQNPRNGRYYSKYGPLNTLSYLPVLSLEKRISGTLPLYNDGTVRTLLLNCQNIALSVVLALVLLELARLYCGRPVPALLWVLAGIYASFGWNYLRAQTAELLQWVLASCFFLFTLRLCRSRACSRWLFAAQISLVLLVLAKGVYALWGLVWLAVLFGCRCSVGVPRLRLRWWLTALLPLLLGAAVVLMCNYGKFGDIWASGYTQWERERNFFSGSLWAGLSGFLFSPDKSIFLYQPLLLLALWGWPEFCRRWRLEGAAVLLAFFLLLVFNSCTINWGGHWSYGPRYLLAVLTPLTLPVLLWAEEGSLKPKTGWAWAGMTVMSGLLLFSLWLQFQVNSLEYFTYYRAEAVLNACGARKAAEELRGLPFGIVNYQLKRFAQTDRLPHFVQTASREVTPTASAALQSELLRQIKGNWYWSDDR